MRPVVEPHSLNLSANRRFGLRAEHRRFELNLRRPFSLAGCRRSRRRQGNVNLATRTNALTAPRALVERVATPKRRWCARIHAIPAPSVSKLVRSWLLEVGRKSEGPRYPGGSALNYAPYRS